MKKLPILFLLAVIFAQIAIAVLPAPRAHAAGDFANPESTIDTTVKKWLYYRAVRSCFDAEQLKTGTVTASDLSSGKWFDDTKVTVGYVSSEVDGQDGWDGTVHCDNASLVKGMLATLGWSSGVAAICAMNQSDPGSYISPNLGDSQCATSASFTLNGNSKVWSPMFKAAKEKLSDPVPYDATDAMYYWASAKTLESYCGDGQSLASTSKPAGGSKTVSATYVDSDTGEKKSVSYALVGEDAEFKKVNDVFYDKGNDGRDGNDMSCEDLANRTEKNADAFANYVTFAQWQDIHNVLTAALIPTSDDVLQAECGTPPPNPRDPSPVYTACVDKLNNTIKTVLSTCTDKRDFMYDPMVYLDRFKAMQKACVSTFKNYASWFKPGTSTKLANAVKAAEPNNAVESIDKSGGGSEDDSCGTEGGDFNWVLCPLSTSIAGFAQKLGGFISSLLFTPNEAIFTPEMRGAWNSFRTIAIALVLIAGLIMVISQALGLDILDAYTIRKLMPRLAIALIGIALSWPLLNVAITLINDLGVWAYQIIIQPFDSAGMDGIAAIGTGKQWTLVGAGGSIAALVALFAGLDIVGVILFIFTIALAMLIGLLVLGIRQVVIMSAVLLAPLAIAAYVLPGTQKLWKFWKETLITSLLMFPIIMGFLAIGDAMSRVAHAGGMPDILSIIIFFAPYFLLPFAFKLAGGLMSTIFSLANDKGGGLFGGLRNARAARRGEMRKRNMERHRWEADNKAAKWGSKAVQTAAIIGSGRAGVSPFKMRGKVDAARSSMGTHDARKALENEAVQAAFSDDFMIDAALAGDRSYNSAVKYFRDRGDDERTAQMRAGMLERAKKAVGREAFEEAAVAANAGTKTGFAGGRHQLNAAINKIAGKDDVKRARMMAAAREAAKAGGRVDLYGGSYGDSIDIAKLQQEDLSDDQRRAIIQRAEEKDPNGIIAQYARKDGQRLTNDQVNMLAGRSVLRNNSVWEVGGGYYIGTENMQGAIITELAEAQNNYQQAVLDGGAAPSQEQQAKIRKAQDEYTRVIAHNSALTQVASQTNGKNADTIGALQGQHFISPTATYEQLVNKDTNPAWETLKNEETGVETRVPKTTLREATLQAEMGVAAYHNYAQSYYAQNVIGSAGAKLTPEQIAENVRLQGMNGQMPNGQPPGGGLPPI